MEALFPLPQYVFTPREAAKADNLGPRRRKSFTASRVVLKHLAYKLGLVETGTQQYNIETLAQDGSRPSLPASGVYCSVSHDNVFVVAVANDKPIGVDIEPLSDKALRGWHIFMSLREQGLISKTNLGEDRTVVRAWTIKEAAAKALDLDLVQAWREVKVLRIGAEKSLARINGRETPFTHLEIQGHVTSLITIDDVERTPK
jgi:phosphopantetheinyl transferase